MAIKVLVVDDSAYSRAALSGLLMSMPEVRHVATAVDGVDGYMQALKFRPDLIMLDLEMPNMDGMTLLRLVRGGASSAAVIVISGRKKGVEASVAFGLGAADYIEKPSMHASGNLTSLKEKISERVRAIPYFRQHDSTKSGKCPSRRNGPAARPGVIAIGASSGGPGAISSVIKALPSGLKCAVIVALHMPPWLTAPFVEMLASGSKIDVRAARDMTPVEPGSLIIAPGGCHMTFLRRGPVVHARVSEMSPSESSAPSIDRMFSSAAEIWGPSLAGIIMTGMGSDGSSGVIDVKRNGGYVIAESRRSSVVHSMPEAAVSTGMVDSVLTSDEIATWVTDRCLPKSLKLA